MARDDIFGSTHTTGELIAAFAAAQPDHPAIAAPGREDLSFSALAVQIEDTRNTLNGIGIGRGDRVALAVQPRPEMAVAHLAVSNAATSLPVDPATPPHEIETVLTDLNANSLIVTEALPSAVQARVVALGVQILVLHPYAGGAVGRFRLSGGMAGPAARHGAAKADDIAQIMRTSGTSSTPKSVPISHRLAVMRGRVEAAAFNLTQVDRCLNFRPLHLHSALNAGLMVPLSVGGTVILPESFDPTGFFGLLKDSAATWFLGSPAYHGAIFDEIARTGFEPGQHSLRFVRSSSYRLDPVEMNRLETLLGVPVLERLGGTEAGLVARNPPPPERRKPGTVGLPVDSEVALLDADGDLIMSGRTGEAGEIVVRGGCVFSGYESDPDATRSAFHADWFRTGDLGRMDKDGYLTVCGRVKEVINRGGQKISPTEVEDLILRHGNIREAVCFRVQHSTLGEDIAAAIVLHDADKGPADLDALRAFLSEELVAYKLPKRLVICDALPRGPTGKLSRGGLADALDLLPLGRVHPSDKAAVVDYGPVSHVNRALTAIWCEILGRPSIGPSENFFAMGGDSLMAARLLARVGEHTGVNLPLDCIFLAGGTIAGMSDLVDKILRDGPDNREARAVAGPIQRRNLDRPAPLSFSQERLRFLTEADPNSHVYNMQGAVRLSGGLDAAVLRKALNEIVARHEVLRSRFPIIDGEMRQIIEPHLELNMPVVDFSEFPDNLREKKVRQLACEEANTLYDMANGPLIRAKLIRCGPLEHVLLLPKHHITFDGQSNGILYAEIAALYGAFSKGAPSPLSPLPVQFADYADWQRQRLSDARLERDARYWLNELSGAPPLLELPADKPRPAEQSYKGGRVWFTLPKELNDRVKGFSSSLGVTPFITLLAGFQLLLYRLSGQNDFVLGTIVGGRIRPEIEELLGLFVNTLALRARFEGVETVAEHVARVRTSAVGAYAHQEMPFDRLVDDLKPDRNAAYAPVVQVLFGLMPKDLRRVELEDLTFERMNIDLGTARFDLSVMIGEDHGALEGFFEYSEDLFERGTIRRLTGYFETVLNSMVSAPVEQPLASISLLGESQIHAVRSGWSGAVVKRVPKDASIDRRFREIAAAAGDRVALISDDQSVSYRALDDWSSEIAQRIGDCGTPPGSIVAIAAERSLPSIAMMLGVLKAGCAFLPLNLALPKSRRDFMLSDSGAALLLLLEGQDWATGSIKPPVLRLHAQPVALSAGRSMPNWRQSSESPAYVMYTSGSTGEPKGVVTPHRGVLRLVTDAHYVNFDENEVFLHLASPAFDAATFEVWGALLNGGSLAIIPQAMPALGEIADTMQRHSVTTAWFTAGLFNQMVDHQIDGFAGLRQVLAGGDVLSPDHAARFVAAHPGCRLVNGYGPTENTTFTTTYTLPADFKGDEPIPIGKPVDGTSLYLLDDNLAPVPNGVPGEIYAGGDGVGLGYLNRPELTQSKFPADPFRTEGGARMYRTGDKGRMRGDGTLDFLGRLDNQLKINGFRIEPGEIEALLIADARVRDSVVVAVRSSAGTTSLAAFFIPADPARTVSEAGLVAALTELLNARLPAYMVPSKLVLTSDFPLTPSGKVDRQALSGMARKELHQSVRAPSAPRTPTEMVLFDIWEELLDHEEFGIDDSFFEIGGNSLLSMKMFFRLQQQVDLELPVSLIFSHPTIRTLALEIFSRLLEQDTPEAPDRSA